MSRIFTDLLRKVASGTHTSKNLTRAEATTALSMILTQTATPAQIGAFLIAHRIKRPTSCEMAGMLDAYDRYGTKLAPVSNSRPVVVLSSPYDGRSRTAPVSPLTGLVLAAAGLNVIMHGGDRMPTKAGIPFIEIWQSLGINWQGLSLAKIQQILNETGFGFVYLADHFPLAQALVTYREQIGKRPPLATLEMLWAPYAGNCHLVCGFVHPPTEVIIQETLALCGLEAYTTIKGDEGSCDLPRDRPAIIGLGTKRLVINARDFGFSSSTLRFSNGAEVAQSMTTSICSSDIETEYAQSVIWNSGFYLWRLGVCADLRSGFAQAATFLICGKVREKLVEIQQAIAKFAH